MTIHFHTDSHCRPGMAEQLNREAMPAAQLAALPAPANVPNVRSVTAEGRSHLFAGAPFFVSRDQVHRMAELIHAVEAVVALPPFQQHVLAWSPDIARFVPGPRSVFFGYDFHLGDGVPQLIEINTNAGGALLNTMFARELREHGLLARRSAQALAAQVEDEIVAMFRAEWARLRGDTPLRSVAVVDTAPAEQYLYPEFQLFERLFRAHGITAVIADPGELALRDGRLVHGDLEIDLVYNRLTDFALAAPAHAAIRTAYLSGAAAVTPHPRAHALYADKRILAVLTDDALLQTWGVPRSLRAVLQAGIPHATVVTAENCEALWARRRQLFFKPACGFGSKGTYRGDKLTRRVWQEILESGYIAQEFAQPGLRAVLVDGAVTELKVDVRNYVYDGRVQLLAARMFQGQTTNFRTPGGGFALVVEVDDARPPLASH
ncbi:hypothetical protein [Pseudoduganella chitinolytica]|uniref:Circularly permuted type 2 ATP-grasp protein n=1 Tax=Pseudoduganella chitinolytica TaxID=34070 RepID=A0ABY8B6J4_9BURK|nr:hypothetical protein [Pseudoduganella chitinolytica]WEF31561.1 hypothetical protein PX653_19140 [Pseudoduganella chitinolytica]